MFLKKGVVQGVLAAVLAGCGETSPTGIPGTGPEVRPCFEKPEGWAGEGITYGTRQSDELLDVIVDAQGHLYLAGYKEGITGEDAIDPSGDARGVVVKVGGLDARGAPTLFAEILVDNPHTRETVEAMAFHPTTGELYFTGRTTGAFGSSFTSKGQQDAFVGKVHEETGTAEVFFQGGTERPQHPNRLAFDGHGDIVVSGFDDTYVPTNYVEAWEDPFVFKLQRTDSSPEFSLQWWTQPKTAQTDTLGGLAVETGSESSIYVTGRDAGGPTRGAFVRKLDAQGRELWSSRQTSIGFDMIQAAHLLEDGQVLIAGSTFAKLGERSFGEQDVVVRKLDPATGAATWTVQLGSEGSDWVTDMAVDARGHIYLVGETLGAMDPAQGHQGNYDVFLVVLDPAGQQLLVRQWGSARDDHPSAVAVDACGQAFIVGYTTGDLFGPSKGERDGFVLAPVMPHAQRGSTRTVLEVTSR